MLPDLKKLVGKRTDVDDEINQCKTRIQERPGDAPQMYLKIGQLYASVEEKEAALEALSNAAQFAAKADDTDVALAANKLIVQLDPENKDALASLAILRFQGGANGFGEDYQKILHDLSNVSRGKESVTTLQDDTMESQPVSKPAHAGRPKTERKRVDKAFEHDRKALHDLIEGEGTGAEPISLESLKFESDRKDLISLIEDSELPGERRSFSRPDKEPFPAPQPTSPTEDREPEQISRNLAANDMPPGILVDLTKYRPPVVQIEDASGGEPAEPIPAQPLPPSPQPDILPGLLSRLPIFAHLPEAAVHQFLQTLNLDVVLTRPFPQKPEDQTLTLTLQIVLPPTAKHSPTPFSWSFGFNPADAGVPPASTPATLELAGTIPAPAFDHPTAFLKELGMACKRRCFLPTLSQSPVFGQLPEDIQTEVAEQCIVVRAAPGTTIIAEGAHDDSLYVIHSGEVKLSATLAEREEVQVIQTEDSHIRLAKLRVGDLFGEDGFLTKEPSTNTVTALTEVYLLKLTAAMLTNLMKAFPPFEALLQHYHQQRAAATMKILQTAVLGKQT